MKEIIEPFRIKVVEPIWFTTREEREAALQEAHGNLFMIPADRVLIDLLTDSGTSSMSAAQWGALMQGDESYAGSPSYYRFRDRVREITGLLEVIPVHQGRAAERLLFSIIGGSGQRIPSNNHFDTTRANIEYTGTIADDLVVDEAADLDSPAPFKGNIDVARLEEYLRVHGREHVPCVMQTVTNNSGGGQPASLENLRAVSAAAHRHGIPFYLDAARFAENAYLIKMREPGQAAQTPRQVARAMFDTCDGALMSLKKDGFGNIGGFLALRDPVLAEEARNLLILTEGFPTYGGLAGRDLEALAVGLDEVLDERYLEYRLACTRYLVDRLLAMGIRVVQPAGGHAVYVDGRTFYPQIAPENFPAQRLAIELYRHGGIRSVEIGSVMFGHRDAATGREIPHSRDLLRLALPRRVYTQAHANYVLEIFEQVFAARAECRGLIITQQPSRLRHFTAHFADTGARASSPAQA